MIGTRALVTVYHDIVHIIPTDVDCGDPGIPFHGTKWVGSTTLDSIVKYMCDQGFTLVGDSFRVCQSNAQWSGALPFCQRECVISTLFKMSSYSSTTMCQYWDNC